MRFPSMPIIMLRLIRR